MPTRGSDRSDISPEAAPSPTSPATATPMRCPACWSTIDEGAKTCPHCNTRIRRGTRPSRLVIGALGVLALGAGGVAAWRLLGPGGADEVAATPSERSAEDEPTTEPVRAADPAPPPTAQPPAGRADRSSSLLTGADGRRVPVLLLALPPGSTDDPSTALALLAAEDLPAVDGLAPHELEARFHGRIAVVHDAPDLGFTLLRIEGFDPDRERDLRPAPPSPDRASAGEGFTAVDARDGTPRPARLDGRLPDGRFTTRGAPAGAAALDDEGRAIGLVLANGDLLPVGIASTWWRNPLAIRTASPLADALAQRRLNDPRALLLEARGTLEATSPSERAIRDALDRIARARALAFDQVLLEAADRLEDGLVRSLVRVLVPDRSAEALGLVERTVAARPEPDPGLLADLVALTARSASAELALERYRLHAARLTGQDARQARDAVVDAVLALLAEDPVRGATLLDRALSILPDEPRLQQARDRLLAEAAREPVDTGSRIEIPLEGGVARVSVRIGRTGTFTYIVDTGAAITTIPTAVADRIGRTGQERRITLTTASGTVETVMMNVPELRIGDGIVLRDVPAAVLDLPDSANQQGLLGLEALRRLRVEIDEEHGKMILQRRR
jgi:clan AA aspartic protease (TIGR02281 family)